ncbi:small acid-soluble spore protein SspI [Cohnella sp. CBP 2801]|uniref:Small, acid-soluble spore protein I n=2 Tax=Cohnella zeiphila TaxID=2761120 RepID=A0A7X0STJ7_9BACL|nr:small acid-soluble spore protein SspI [Cohnella zeiphila]MBB6734894.1 small acid-soluble spore protein SspI [Cohnella zeiphila]
MSLREAIIKRVEDKNDAELQEVIQDSIGNAEVTLPGLGVLFEIIWQHSAAEDRQRMVKTLHDQIQNSSPNS